MNGRINEEIYLKPPPGFEGSYLATHACRLKRALYSLKRAPRRWYSTVDSFLQREGLQKSTTDCNLYFFEAGGLLTLMLLYVDDVYIIENNDAHITHIRAAIQGGFEMSDLGLLAYSLGIEFLFSSSGIMMTQRQYIQ